MNNAENTFRTVSSRKKLTFNLRNSLLRKISRSAKNKILILYYHRVIDQEDDYLPGIPTKIFKAQMHYLSENFSFVSLNEIVEHITEKKKLPPHPVVVTFDDGYRDIYTNAYPTLKKYGVPATIFLTVNYFEEIPWWDKISYMFFRTKEKFITWDLSGKLYSLETRLKSNKAAREITKDLTQIEEGKKNKLIKTLSEQLNVNVQKQDNERLMLSWKEVKEMADTGILFGSHTLTHPILTRTSKEQVKGELIESKEILEKKIEVPIDHICYPNGLESDFDSEIKEIARKAGYTCACTLIRGFNNSQTDLYELRRGHPSKLFTYLFATLRQSI